MKHRATPRFWRCYERLPEEVRSQADACFQLLKDNPRHPSLHFKKIGRLWSVRIGLGYRALALDSDPDVVWFWIGTHGEYDSLLSRS